MFAGEQKARFRSSPCCEQSIALRACLFYSCASSARMPFKASMETMRVKRMPRVMFWGAI